MSDGWKESAAAWIANTGDEGDYARKYILDAPMLERIAQGAFQTALDVGCGEGRFCRMLRKRGLNAVGIDPIESLIEHARQRDPDGDYRLGKAGHLEFPDGSFDLVINYLTLIDIPDIKEAIAEFARVLRPGGALLIANLTSFNTAGPPTGWVRDGEGEPRFYIDRYLEERPQWVAWDGIRVQNWHRPLSTYMSLLLGQGLELRHFAEPSPVGGDPQKNERYNRVPWFCMMEWRKPRSAQGA